MLTTSYSVLHQRSFKITQASIAEVEESGRETSVILWWSKTRNTQTFWMNHLSSCMTYVFTVHAGKYLSCNLPSKDYNGVTNMLKITSLTSAGLRSAVKCYEELRQIIQTSIYIARLVWSHHVSVSMHMCPCKVVEEVFTIEPETKCLCISAVHYLIIIN